MFIRFLFCERSGMFDIGTTEGQAILFGGIGAGLIAVVLLLLFVLHKQGRCCFSGASGSVRRHSTTRRRGPRGSELTRTNSTHSKAQQPQSSGYATSAGDLADFLENLVDGMERGRGAGGGGAGGGGGGRDGASPRVIAGSGGGAAGKYNRADFSLITMQTQPNMNEPAIPTQEGGGAERTTSLLDDDMMLAGGGITHQKKAEITSWVASVLRQRTAEPLPHAAPVHHDDDDVVDISAMIPTSGSELGGPPSAPGNGALAATHIVSVFVDEASGGAEAKIRAMSHHSSPGVALYCRDVTEDELSAQGPRATSTTDQQRREAAGEADAAGRAGVESASAVGRASAADTPRVSQAASDTSR